MIDLSDARPITGLEPLPAAPESWPAWPVVAVALLVAAGVWWFRARRRSPSARLLAALDGPPDALAAAFADWLHVRHGIGPGLTPAEQRVAVAGLPHADRLTAFIDALEQARFSAQPARPLHVDSALRTVFRPDGRSNSG